MDFSLQELTDIYIELLSPLVRSDKYGTPAPCYLVYNDVMDMLEQIKARGGSKDMEFYNSVIGSDTVQESKSEYNELSMVLELGGLAAVKIWSELPLMIQARIRAQKIIQGMVEVISSYYREMDAARKRQLNGGK